MLTCTQTVLDTETHRRKLGYLIGLLSIRGSYYLGDLHFRSPVFVPPLICLSNPNPKP